MRKCLLFLVMLFAMPTAQAQVQLGIGDMFRSLSGALRGKETQPQKQEGATPVMGVRGIDETDQAQTAPAAGDDYVLMEGWAATRPEAVSMAEANSLAARPVVLKKSPATPAATEGATR
jgi:hypothetical protein